MKKCTFFSFCGLMIMSTLLFSVNSYADGQHVEVGVNDNGFIYFMYPDLMPYTKEINGQQYAAIKKLTCRFSTKYSGTISFFMRNEAAEPETKTITSNTPMTYVFSGYMPYIEGRSPSFDFYNFGCNSGTDGDKCIEAKQQKIDTLIIDCY